MIEEIKQRMTKLGVTQTKLARRLGWTQSLISQYLVQSFLAKQASNKTPTAAEARAYQRALDSRVLSQLKSVSPDFFNQLFAIQNKQRFDWEERYEFPCGRARKSIDVLAVLQAIKHLIAVNRKYLGIGKAKSETVGDDEIDINEAKRLEAIERRKKTEVQLERENPNEDHDPKAHTDQNRRADKIETGEEGPDTVKEGADEFHAGTQSNGSAERSPNKRMHRSRKS